MSTDAKILWPIAKTMVLAVVMALSFVFVPDAMAHGAVLVASRDASSEAIRLHTAQVAVGAAQEEATPHFRAATLNGSAVSRSGAPASERDQCHDSCCCGVVVSCASCCGAAISLEICVNVFLLTVESLLPSERVPLGLPPVPADPPPRTTSLTDPQQGSRRR